MTDIEHLIVFGFEFPLDDENHEGCVGFKYNDALFTNYQMDKLLATIDYHYDTEYE